MNSTYTDWIKTHYPTPKSAWRQCQKATEQMARAFPELTRVRGHILAGLCYHQHWWLVDPQNQIVDPTSHQFESMFLEGMIFEYTPLPADAEEPLGKCLNCGELIFLSLGGDSYHCHECIS